MTYRKHTSNLYLKLWFKKNIIVLAFTMHENEKAIDRIWEGKFEELKGRVILRRGRGKRYYGYGNKKK